MPVIYPFTAIVGQERMKRALVLNAVDPRIGGVLIRGERGTAKSTAARALAALLPHVRVVADCRFGCDPDRPVSWCTECRERAERGEQLPTSSRATPFINLPISATEDRVVGTLDIEKAIQRGERHFEPGVLAAANRGLLYIDEVNLLDDHVVDVLLDSAAMGMKLVSPCQRGTIWKCRCRVMPAPATLPRFMPMLKPAGLTACLSRSTDCLRVEKSRCDSSWSSSLNWPGCFRGANRRWQLLYG